MRKETFGFRKFRAAARKEAARKRSLRQDPHWPSSVTEAQIKKAISLLSAFSKAADEARDSFLTADGAYLTGCYQKYVEWADTEMRKKEARRWSLVSGARRRQNQHALHVIVRSTSSFDRREVSRRVKALRYARVKRVAPANLMAFLADHGGVSGCARLFTRWLNKNKKRKRKAKPAS